jgi:hypothetical protein
MVAAPLLVAAPNARAAPMTGVEFVDVVRFVDTSDVPATTFHFTMLPTPPVGATQALINIGVAPADTATTGVVMVHDCGAVANPATDVVLPLQHGPAFVTNEVFAPISGGVLCVTTTAHTTRLVADLYGWVGSGTSAYVDTPFTLAGTISGPADGAVLDLSGLGVGPDATGVAVWLDISSTTAGFATLYRCDQPRPLTSQANWVGNVPTSIVVAGVSTAGASLCIYITDGATIDVSLDGYYSPLATPSATSPPQVRFTQGRAPGFVGTSPQRLFDTRSGGAPIIGGQSYRFDLSSYVPADTSAVVMNLTATETSAAGFVTAYPCDGTQPDTSNLNFVAGQTVPNLVTVDVGLSQEVCFFASVSTHLLADLAGYYVFGGGDGFAPSPPVRMLDTRNLETGVIGPAKVAGHGVFDFDVSSFVPPNATAIVFNLTATDVVGPGFVTAYQCGQQPPTASNLNVLPGQTVPNLVTVAIPSTFKHVCFFTTSPLNLIADLAGWYSPTASSGFISIFPTRWADTRDISTVPLPAGSVYFVDFSLDFPDATATVFNATATEPLAAGYLTAFPCGPTVPDASNVNFVAGQSVPNMAISAVDSFGRVCIFNSAEAHWIMDVSGYFTDALQFVAFFPAGTDNL